MIVYKITNAITGKIYVGLTKRTASARLAAHFYAASRAPKCRGHLHAAMRISAKNIWRIEEICQVETWADAAVEEVRQIALLQSNNPAVGYNITSGGDGAPGRKQSPAEIERRAAACRGRKRSAEVRAKISAATKGKKKSAQHIANNAAARRGYKKTQTQIERSAKFHRGRTRSTLTRARQSAARKAYYEGIFLTNGDR